MINHINNYNSLNNYKANVSFKAKPVSSETALSYINKIKDYGAKRIHLYGHSSLDDDAECSKHVFSHLLKKLGIKNYICARKEQIRGLYLSNSKEIKKGTKQPDLIVTLDFNDIRRIPKLFKKTFEKNKPGNIVGLDHHLKTDTLKGDFYIDDTAHSCCGIVFRFAEALGVKLGKKDFKSLYCGMLSDYQKSKLIKIENGQIIKMPALFEDKNSLEVLGKVEKQLNNKAKAKVLKHLDIMANLNKNEKDFMAKLFSMVEVTPNGKLAYAIIDPHDKQWAEIGMDNDRTSAIIRDLRLRLLNGIEKDKMFTQKQKENSKNLKAAMVFYRTSGKTHGCYQMSIHSKDGYAQKLLKYIKANINPNLEGDGHEDRAGGRIHSIVNSEINKFINSFLEAAKNID